MRSEVKLRKAARAAMANRMFRRERFDWRVKILLPNGGRIDTVYGRTCDISYGGMGVVITRAVKQDTPVLVVFRLPQIDCEIQLPAFVTHGVGFRCGLRFAKLSAEQKFLVQRICRALAA